MSSFSHDALMRRSEAVWTYPLTVVDARAKLVHTWWYCS